MKSEFHFIEDCSLLLHCLCIKLPVGIHGVIIYFVVHHVLLCSKWENICNYDCPINSGDIYIYICVCVCVCVYIYIYIYMYVCVCVYIYIYIYILILNLIEMSIKCTYWQGLL